MLSKNQRTDRVYHPGSGFWCGLRTGQTAVTGFQHGCGRASFHWAIIRRVWHWNVTKRNAISSHPHGTARSSRGVELLAQATTNPGPQVRCTLGGLRAPIFHRALSRARHRRSRTGRWNGHRTPHFCFRATMVGSDGTNRLAVWNQAHDQELGASSVG